MSTSLATEPAFDEVHVVSDLHLGGPPGQQIFNQGPRLAALIRWLKARKARSVALVLNGDVVDFLADPNAGYLDPAGAVTKLDTIIKDQAFAGVWQELREFIATPEPTEPPDPRVRTLVIVLGNHDVELALPHVRQWLTNWLAGKDEAARGRVTWATDGAGFLCTVRNKKVLCVHGNEVDSWNVVDHRALLGLVRAYQRSMPYPTWTPNGGTKLVIDVMNSIKKMYPFVDLLKPETKAAIPILLGIEPKVAAKLGQALASVTRKSWDGLKMSAGFLGEEEGASDERPDAIEALDFMLRDLPSPEPIESGDAKILEAQRRIERGERRVTKGTADDTEYLGISDWFAGWNRPGALRAAVKALVGKDTTFDALASDDSFGNLDKAVGADVDYLIAGHTHLRRALKRQFLGRYYYNTGTWIRLIKIDQDHLDDPKKFEHVLKGLKSKTLEALDQAKDTKGEHLVTLLPTVASIVTEGNSAYGELCDVDETGEPKPIENTRFPRKAAGNG